MKSWSKANVSESERPPQFELATLGRPLRACSRDGQRSFARNRLCPRSPRRPRPCCRCSLRTMPWEHWASKAPRTPWWSPGRPLRVATDCSGLGIPELALRELAREHGSTMDSVFACDVAVRCKQWLHHAEGHDSNLGLPIPATCATLGPKPVVWPHPAGLHTPEPTRVAELCSSGIQVGAAWGVTDVGRRVQPNVGFSSRNHEGQQFIGADGHHPDCRKIGRLRVRVHVHPVQLKRQTRGGEGVGAGAGSQNTDYRNS